MLSIVPIFWSILDLTSKATLKAKKEKMKNYNGGSEKIFN